MTNLLPLETWRREMGFSRWHFWGLADDSVVPVTANCDSVVYQYNYQGNDRAGREEVLSAIERAEDKLREQLGFRVAPAYASQTVPWPRYFNSALVRYGSSNARGQRMSVKLINDGYVQALGVETKTLINTVAVAYSDPNGDGLNESFTLTVATTVTNTDEIAVYFAAADRLNGESATDKWRIQPVSVSISGGTATIRGNGYMLVKPIKYEDEIGVILNPATSSNFVTNLEVYRRYTDSNGETTSTAQATLRWETHPCNGWWCCDSSATHTPADSSLDPAAVAVAVGRAGIRDERLGIVTPGQAVRNATTGIWAEVGWDTCYEPDRVTLRYLAGQPLENGQMARRWQQIVARMAAAELEQPICACRDTNRTLHYWQQDLALESTETERFTIPEEDLRNPFGTRRGHVAAWKEIKGMIIRPGFLPG